MKRDLQDSRGEPHSDEQSEGEPGQASPGSGVNNKRKKKSGENLQKHEWYHHQ